MWYDVILLESSLCHVTHVVTILTLGAKNRKGNINQIENRKKSGKELSPLLAILTLRYIRKTNTKVDILFRKDQVDTIDVNKDVKLLKNKL